VRQCNTEIGGWIQRCEQARGAVRVSLDDCGIVEAIRVPERNLARALPGPDLASFVDEFAYPFGGRVVRDAVDPDVEEVQGNSSNTPDLSESRKQITNSVLHPRRRFDEPAGEDASLSFWEFRPEVLQRRLAREEVAPRFVV